MYDLRNWNWPVIGIYFVAVPLSWVALYYAAKMFIHHFAAFLQFSTVHLIGL